MRYHLAQYIIMCLVLLQVCSHACRSSQYMDEVVTTQIQGRCLCQQSQKTRMGQCPTGRQGSAWLLSR